VGNSKLIERNTFLGGMQLDFELTATGNCWSLDNMKPQEIDWPLIWKIKMIVLNV